MHRTADHDGIADAHSKPLRTLLGTPSTALAARAMSYVPEKL